MSYKMILLDMDGTLLSDEKIIPQINITLIQWLYAMGLKIVIATGRRYLSARREIERLRIPTIIISNNGGSMWDMEDNRKLYAKYIDANVFFAILDKGHKRNLHPLLHVDHFEEGYDIFTEFEANHPVYHSYLSSNVQRHRIMEDLNKYKYPKVMIMCYMAGMDILEAFQGCLKRTLSGKFHSHIALSLKHIGPLLEISAPQGTKWHTALHYANSLGIKPAEIIAIGDDNNDCLMLENAGLGIAMKNVTPEAKRAASLVSPFDNNEGGVGKILGEIFSLPV